MADLADQETKKVEEIKDRLKDTLAQDPSLSVWHVPIAQATSPESTPEERAKAENVITKYLRASEGIVDTAVTRLLATAAWRKNEKVDEILRETFPENFDEAGFIHKSDREGRPIIYNVYGVHQDIFADLQKFLRWRVQLMEKGVGLLDFAKVDTMVQVHDYEGVSLFSSTEQTKAAARETVKLFGDHYPELLSKKFFINVPWYMAGFYSFLQPIIPARTAQKFVICSSSYKEELLRVVPVENLPVSYGGLSKRGNEKQLPFQPPAELEAVPATKITVAAGTFTPLEIKLEAPSTVYYEFVLLDADIEFAASFVEAEGGKLTQVEKVRKVPATITLGKYEAATVGTFKLVWDNAYSFMSAKQVFYRFLVVPAAAEQSP